MHKWKYRLWLYVAIAIAALGVVAVFYPWSILNGKVFFGKWYFNINDYGSLGSFVAGISTPFLSLATVILLWRTYALQNIQIKEQRSAIRKQRFDDIFFNLLQTHNGLVDAIDLRSSSDFTKIIAVKRDCFRIMHDNFKKDCSSAGKTSIEDTLEIYGGIQNRFKADLTHYFRFTFRILKFIKEYDDMDFEEKYDFAATFRAVFSPYEIIFLFYHGLYGSGKSKVLYEEFSFLKDMDFSLLISEEHKHEYHDVAFGDFVGKKRKEKLREFKREQSEKKAK